MLLPRMLPLPMHQPKLPDHWLCSPTYGKGIDPIECQLAVDTQWPSGNTPIHYYLRDPAPSNGVRIPRVDRWNTCQVVIEPAGPDSRYPEYFKVRPNEMRALAGFVIDKCAVEHLGMGGFVTLGFATAESYLHSVVGDWIDDVKNSSDNNTSSGAFLTISINGSNRTSFSPGNTDPTIAVYLSRYAAYSAMLFNENLTPYYNVARFLRDRAVAMVRGGASVWWDGGGFARHSSGNTAGNGETGGAGYANGEIGDGIDDGNGGRGMDLGSKKVAPSEEEGGGDEVFDEGEMTYQCDNTLNSGSNHAGGGGGQGPDPIDCEKLSWSGLPGSSDPDSMITLSGESGSGEAGKPQFWTQGTCTLAVSSSLPGTTTIRWANVLAAFETLTNLCMTNPVLGRSKGGRAYWGKQKVGSWIHGKKRKKRGVRGKGEDERKEKDDEEEETEGEEKGFFERDGVGRVDGAMALPKGFNVTIFRGGGSANAGCDWVLAQEGKNSSMCNGG